MRTEAEHVQYNTRFKVSNVCFETKLICLLLVVHPLIGHLLRRDPHFQSTSKTWFGSVLLIGSALCVVVFALLVLVTCLVCIVLPVSLDFPFLIDPSVFSGIYLPVCGTYISQYNLSFQRSVFISRYRLLFSLIPFKNLQ